MNTRKPEVLDPEGSILFLGSGFSAGATNISDKKLPTGGALRKIFADIIGVEQNDYDLPTLAGEIASNPGINLYQILYGTFTTKSLSAEQIEIFRLPWLRVYTTNYDDVAEFAYKTNKQKIYSFSYDEDKPRKLAPGSIVHLHGVIRKTTPENVKEQLVLNEHSYVRQHFEHSPWYDEFIRDIRFCTNCYFLGYSLSDYHISALLFQLDTLQEKTFFLTRKADQIFENRVREYGTVLPIGVNGFVDLIKSLPRAKRLQDPYSLKSLRYIDPHKDKKTSSPPTPIEVLNLVTFGAFNEQRCMSSLPHPTYVVPRRELANASYDLLAKAKTLLVHSRLGNGKSIFLNILAHRLSEGQYTCFWCREVTSLLKQEAKTVASLGKVVILFDSYNVAIDAINAIDEEIPNAKFVIAIRTGIQEVRLHEIQRRLPMPIERQSINGLRKPERDVFINLLDEAGILAKDIRTDIAKCEDIREIVTTIYKNAKIREKLESELQPLLMDRSMRTIIIASHLIKWAGLDGGAAFLRAVTGKDAFAEASRFKEVVADFFLFGDDELQVHSAVFSEYLIKNFFDAEDVVDMIFAIVVEAVKRKRERRYQAIMSKMMQVSTMKRVVHAAVNKDILLAGLFDRLHRDIEVNNEPLFWLQYSILMMDSQDLVAAEKFLGTAYSRASEIPGFRTFQIDTHSLRLLLRVEQEVSNSMSVERFDEIVEKLDKVISMAGEESHRAFALRVLNEIEPFIRLRMATLSISERNALLIQIDRLIRTLEGLVEQGRVYDNESTTLKSVERAKAMLLKG